MSDNNKSYRIRANVGGDKVLNVNLNQDFNVLEVLSLKIDTDNLYRFHTSDYGCIAGRVLANGNFGIPNAKISIFIAVDNEDSEDDIISYLYPYKATSSKNVNKIRYNLFPEDQLSDCHRNVGTFPSKRTVLDDNHILEIYDKYYKYTTRSNQSGDYMIFGVPTGNQTIHVDIDLSDIGPLSQRPRDMVYKGYNITQFENGNMFKKSNNLDTLAQIITQNQNVYVYPFWGEDSEGEIAITRRDIEIQYEFTPTCVFIGSLITDEPSNGISKRCIPSERMGKMDRLTTGNGTIEMIRKTPNGGVEETIIQGNTLIDGNGTWCYQIPMNLDYVKTDEYGNTVPTDDPTKGVATRACVRFRFSLTEFENEGGYSHVSKVLVPHNPKYYNNKERGENKDGAILDYVFGTNTDDASFKNLFSNNVYTVKSFIPRFQMLNLDRNKRFSGIKAVNVNDNNNPIPYNNIRVDLTFMFVLQCAVFKVLLWVIGAMNAVVSALASLTPYKCLAQKIDVGGQILGADYSRCLYIGDGYCPEMDGWYFAPGCNNSKLLKKTFNKLRMSEDVTDSQSIDAQNKDESENSGRLCLSKKVDYFVQCVEIHLAMEHDVIQLDFYNDWINGMIYAPRWFADIRPKRSYLFGLIRVSPRVNGCMESGYRAMFSRRYTQQCALSYETEDSASTDYVLVTTPKGCKSGSTKQKCHKSKGRKTIKIFASSNRPGGGVVHDEQTLEKKYAYYFRPCEWFKNGRKCNLFATDIVLLGSLDKNNPYGIPQTFEKLSSTSYQIPDALASTNAGMDGFVYGTDGGGTICNGTTENGVIAKETTKRNIIDWTRGKDFYESEPYDNDEELVTEAAGIDWGYTGPGQGKNDFNKLYYPGGHFLGISCFNSETNIKSCINLSRICEQGSIISQRQTVIRKNKEGSSYTYEYLIPTGLIAGESINDYGFKNEFATLNYNGLKIKQDEDTLLSKYDFETIIPINFNGELSKFVDSAGDVYNRVTGRADTTDGGGDVTYVRTIEENSSDYYRFRFGLPLIHTKDDAKKRFLIEENNAVSLPVYENSFYFYFGLKGGNTAIDRFFKDFYAECPPMRTYEPEVKIITEDGHFCGDDGKATIILKNIEGGKVEIENKGDAQYAKKTAETDKACIIEGLPADTEIFVSIYGDNINSIQKTFTIDAIYPESFSAVTCSGIDYTEEYEDFITGTASGKICFSGSSDGDIFQDSSVFGIIISTDDFKKEVSETKQKPYASLLLNSNYNGKPYITEVEKKYECFYTASTNTINDVVVNAWAGNKYYTVRILYGCSFTHNEEVVNMLKEHEYETLTISMPEELDIVFDGYRYASYRHLIKPLLDGAISTEKENVRRCWFNATLVGTGNYEGWYKKIKNTVAFKGDEGEERFKNTVYHLKRALLFRNSQAELSGGLNSIPMTIVGGKLPYTIEIKGYGELVDGDGDGMKLFISSGIGTTEQMAESGYSVNLENFISPTINVDSDMKDNPDAPITINNFFDYSKGGSDKDKNKGMYIITVTDANGKKIENISIPSIYRPFFDITLYISEIDGTGHTSVKTMQVCKSVVANPISRHLDNGTRNGDIIFRYSFTGDTPETTYLKAPDIDYSLFKTEPKISDNPKVERYYNIVKHRTDSKETNLKIDGNYSISVQEDNGNGEERSAELTATFLGDGKGLDRRVRYIPVRREIYEALKKATVLDEKDKKEGEFINYQLSHNANWAYLNPLSRVTGEDENGFLFNPLFSAVLKETNVEFEWGDEGPFENQDEVPYDAILDASSRSYKDIFDGERNKIPIKDYTVDRYGVVGIAESSYYYTNEFDAAWEEPVLSTKYPYALFSPSDYIYSYSPRHTSTISVIRLYKTEMFWALAANPYKLSNDPDIWN